MSDRGNTSAPKKAKSTAPKHKINSKSRASKVNPIVEKELNELITNLDLLKPVKKDWRYRIGEFIGQLILTVVALIL